MKGLGKLTASVNQLKKERHRAVQTCHSRGEAVTSNDFPISAGFMALLEAQRGDARAYCPQLVTHYHVPGAWVEGAITARGTKLTYAAMVCTYGHGHMMVVEARLPSSVRRTSRFPILLAKDALKAFNTLVRVFPDRWPLLIEDMQSDFAKSELARLDEMLERTGDPK